MSYIDNSHYISIRLSSYEQNSFLTFCRVKRIPIECIVSCAAQKLFFSFHFLIIKQVGSEVSNSSIHLKRNNLFHLDAEGEKNCGYSRASNHSFAFNFPSDDVHVLCVSERTKGDCLKLHKTFYISM